MMQPPPRPYLWVLPADGLILLRITAGRGRLEIQEGYTHEVILEHP